MNFSNVLTFTPGNATIAAGVTLGAPNPGGVPALGDVVGTLGSDKSLGVSNGACSLSIHIDFIFMNATVENTGAALISPLAPAAAPGSNIGGRGAGVLANMRDDDDGDGNPGEPEDSNGLPNHVDHYPDFLNDIFNDLAPLARYSASSVVANEAVLREFLIFDTGDLAAHFDPPHPLSDIGSENGYTSVTVRNDPTQPLAPTAITDYCTPLANLTILFGESKTNLCNGDGSCTVVERNELTGKVGGTITGHERYRNPPAGTALFSGFDQSLRDYDMDGLENDFDTCPYGSTLGYNPRLAGDRGGAKDADSDGIPATTFEAGCDNNDSGGGTNEDGDFASNGEAWLNTGDNCPQMTDGDSVNDNEEDENNQTDWVRRFFGGPQTDGIGDVCDNSITTADGHFHTTHLFTPVCIGEPDADGDGWCDDDDPQDGNASPAGGWPESASYVRSYPLANLGSGGTTAIGGLVGEPFQMCNDGIDNDGDTKVDQQDTGCGDSGKQDSDGDGYTDMAEAYIGTNPLSRCGTGAGPDPSVGWPSDFISGSIPVSTDKLTIADLVDFIAPVRHFGTSPPAAEYDRRWDLQPGSGVLPTWINVNDMAAMIAGATGNPPMGPYAGARAFGDPTPCDNVAVPEAAGNVYDNEVP
jgi:hypothetical protein